jgi:hypothetical protein
MGIESIVSRSIQSQGANVASMLRAMLRACWVQHPNISGPPPFSPNVAIMLLLYYDHVTTRVACNIQHQELSTPSSTQIPTSHVYNIEIQHPQH